MQRAMIYCVIPPELADDLYDKLVEYYEDNPNVKVIIDRRGNRSSADDEHATEKAKERRRPRIPGTFPDIEAH
jgi:hypothetical protein